LYFVVCKAKLCDKRQTDRNQGNGISRDSGHFSLSQLGI